MCRVVTVFARYTSPSETAGLYNRKCMCYMYYASWQTIIFVITINLPLDVNIRM